MNKKIKEFLIPFMKIDEHRRLISSIACQYSDEEFEEKVTKGELQDIITHLMEIVSIKTNSLNHDNVEELHVIEELTNILSLKI